MAISAEVAYLERRLSTEVQHMHAALASDYIQSEHTCHLYTSVISNLDHELLPACVVIKGHQPTKCANDAHNEVPGVV